MKGYNDNMPYGKEKLATCAVCGIEFTHMKKLSNHIKKEHGLSPQEYTIKYFYNGITPACPECGELPRYRWIGKYNEYCSTHAKMAMSTAGRRGGKAEAWSKGKTKDTDDRLRIAGFLRKGESNPFYGKKHSAETLKLIASKNRTAFSDVIEKIKKIHSDITVLSDSTAYKTQDSKLSISCNVCATKSEVSFVNLKRCWHCRTCQPNGSRQEIEIANYIKSLGIDNIDISTRNIIGPLELDVWVPEHKLAIEHHGLYWHSGGKDGVFLKTRHRDKYLACKAQEIRLMQFFSDEWRDKREICESMISHALGMSKHILNGRDCVVAPVSHIITQPFLDKCHIDGCTKKASFHLVLIHKHMGNVGVMTLRKPQQKKHGNVLEVARMAFGLGMSVRGGASKLLKHAEKIALQEKYDGIMSYADLRFGGEGSVYEKCKFERIGETSSLNYWYTNGKIRKHRFEYRAQPGKQERQVAKEAGVRAVYGCGNAVYIKSL